ncbi:nucleotide exchange factor GrpE [Pseudothauera rhizosphaerae]|uniref:Protein GrpE n=1 Tax=Pseudothauera rhizosphaerae TaxID=2565932 RepID=A0A4S4ASF1_9RHOO|nr:nucleotide exchange factor GrpE [Pseudothauera rhizosphaerae]THF62762.1 nucleotide exchange factor GrpE [Pseudothauera rhizosphaerae]
MQEQNKVPQSGETLENHSDAAAQTAAEGAAGTPEGRTDTLPSLEESLRQAELKAAEHHDAWLRAKAETENVRRRAQEDIAKASKFAAEKFAGAILPVKDSLEAALATENQTLEKLREGVELTLKQLAGAFESASLTEENPLGQKFDPNKHQAIGALESDAEPNTVINVLQKGYLLHERVLRPALVMVAKAQ